MQLIDPSHPVYRHLWVRITIVVVCFSWSGMEFIGGDPMFGVLAGGAGLYSAYMLLLKFNPQPPAEPEAPKDVEKSETE